MLVNRHIYKEIVRWIDSDLVLILKGARQVGKTTLMRQLQANLDEQNKKTLFLSADDISIGSIFESPQVFVEYLKRNGCFVNAEKSYVFIDEFQYIKNAGLFIKNIFDQYKTEVKLIVSGSSSLEITNSTEFLTGRHLSFRVTPFSFREFVEFKMGNQIEPLTDFKSIELFYSAMRPQLESYFTEYLTVGGYPAVAITENFSDKMFILKSLLQVYVEKDIVSYFRFTNLEAFQNLLKILANQVGSLVNIKELSETLGADQDTIKKYIEVLEGTYVIGRLNPFFTNARKSIRKMKKVFIADMGMMNFINNNLETLDLKINLGKEVENFVYAELSRIYDHELHFYRTLAGQEIDFFINNSRPRLIEVKYKGKPHISKVAFDNFYKTNQINRSSQDIVITKDMLDEREGILYLPVVLLSFVNLYNY
jgi:predicted AAA+ superfamily ATPase